MSNKLIFFNHVRVINPLQVSESWQHLVATIYKYLIYPQITNVRRRNQISIVCWQACLVLMMVVQQQQQCLLVFWG